MSSGNSPLAGKTVYLSQASGAVGCALIRSLAEKGASLALGQMEDDARAAAQACGAEWIEVHPDLCLCASIDEMIQQVSERFGRIDVCIYNNADVRKCRLADMPMELFWQQFDANCRGAFFLCRQMGIHMGKFHNGKIIFLSSIHDDKPNASAPAFSIAKGGLKMLVKESALQLGRRGIQTNLIEMGGMKGDDQLFESDISQFYFRYEEKMPRRKAGRPEEICGLVAFLAGNESDFINGAIIRADGGLTYNYGVRPVQEGELPC